MDSVSDWFSVNLDELFETAMEEGPTKAKKTPTRVDLVFQDNSLLRITTEGIFAIDPAGTMTHKKLFGDDDDD